MNIIIKYVAFLLLLLNNNFFYGQNEIIEENPIEYSLKDGVEKHLVQIKIIGAYDPGDYDETFDYNGIHYGKCMILFLESKTENLLSLKLEAGTELLPIDTTFQKMIVTKLGRFRLSPNESIATKFYAMCGEINKESPYVAAEYNLGLLGDNNTIKIARYLDEHSIQNMIGQHALWAYTDNVGFEKLKNYGADSLSITKTKEILTAVNIITKLNKIDSIKESNDTIAINKELFYGSVILILIIFLGCVYFISKKKKDL